MRYQIGNSPGANFNGIVDNNSLLTSGRTKTAPVNIGSMSASSGNGIEAFVNYKCSHYESVTVKPVPVLPNTRVCVPRNFNYMNVGSHEFGSGRC